MQWKPPWVYLGLCHLRRWCRATQTRAVSGCPALPEEWIWIQHNCMVTAPSPTLLAHPEMPLISLLPSPYFPPLPCAGWDQPAHLTVIKVLEWHREASTHLFTGLPYSLSIADILYSMFATPWARASHLHQPIWAFRTALSIIHLDLLASVSYFSYHTYWYMCKIQICII